MRTKESMRPYKEAFPVPKSLDIMRQERGVHFDPQVLDVFLERLEEILEIKDRLG